MLLLQRGRRKRSQHLRSSPAGRTSSTTAVTPCPPSLRNPTPFHPVVEQARKKISIWHRALCAAGTSRWIDYRSMKRCARNSKRAMPSERSASPRSKRSCPSRAPRRAIPPRRGARSTASSRMQFSTRRSSQRCRSRVCPSRTSLHRREARTPTTSSVRTARGVSLRKRPIVISPRARIRLINRRRWEAGPNHRRRGAWRRRGRRRRRHRRDSRNDSCSNRSTEAAMMTEAMALHPPVVQAPAAACNPVPPPLLPPVRASPPWPVLPLPFRPLGLVPRRQRDRPARWGDNRLQQLGVGEERRICIARSRSSPPRWRSSRRSSSVRRAVVRAEEDRAEHVENRTRPRRGFVMDVEAGARLMSLSSAPSLPFPTRSALQPVHRLSHRCRAPSPTRRPPIDPGDTRASTSQPPVYRSRVTYSIDKQSLSHLLSHRHIAHRQHPSIAESQRQSTFFLAQSFSTKLLQSRLADERIRISMLARMCSTLLPATIDFALLRNPRTLCSRHSETKSRTTSCPLLPLRLTRATQPAQLAARQ